MAPLYYISCLAKGLSNFQELYRFKIYLQEDEEIITLLLTLIHCCHFIMTSQICLQTSYKITI